MVIEGLDPVLISKLTSQQVEQVTCIECCKFYQSPTTALCGHSLCAGCWKGRRNCYVCSAPVNRKRLQINIPLKTLTDHIHVLGDAFEKLFNQKLDEVMFDINNKDSDDPTKHVKEWLASSQNHFSAPISTQNSDQGDLPHIELSKSKVQVHTLNKKAESPAKVIRPPNPQDDWDKIEVLADTEEINPKPKHNVIGPMDIEPFFFDDNEYTTGNPRRSSRNRDQKSDTNPYNVEVSSAKNSSHGTDQKSNKTKQTWSNVKKMRKEFSRLTKKNKSKLNVSIEMCKKAQSVAKKPALQSEAVQPNDSEQTCINIEDNTPDCQNKKTSSTNTSAEDGSKSDNNATNKMVVDEPHNEKSVEINSKLQNKKKVQKYSINTAKNKQDQCINNSKENVSKSIDIIEKRKQVKSTEKSNEEVNINQHMPFIKMGTLRQKSLHNDSNVQITHNEVQSNTINTDDIEISIKIGNTITNIVIKNKQNDIQMKVNSDREVQTSLGSHSLPNKNDMACSPIKEVNVHNIVLNVNKVNEVVEKSISTKKNTATADTATAQFEITNSVEKELSDIMECVESAGIKSKAPVIATAITKPTPVSESHQIEKEAEHQDVQENMDYLNDIDIFNSGSVKEQSVKLLKDSKPAPSEIIMSTIKSKKTQKNKDKRDRDINSDSELPCSKKQKVDKGNENVNAADESTTEQAKAVTTDSEPINYDVLMSQVFANIDADIQSDKNSDKKYTQVLKKKTDNTENPKNYPSQASQIIQKTQRIPNTSVVKEVVNQKYSENVFSMLDKDSEPHDQTLKNKAQQARSSSTQQHIENLLTPGMCRNLENENETQMDKDIQMLEPVMGTPVVDQDDSDKSVVEETPQKNVSFAKPKQALEKQASKPDSQLKECNAADKMADSQIIRSIINISDTTEDFSKEKEVTVQEMTIRKNTLETPLNINKFVNQIKHNSTPIARKSLNFEKDSEDIEETLCPTTTQEKEFLAKVFEKTQNTPKRLSINPNRKLFVAGSCLTSTETKDLKTLCQQRGWTYLDKYSDDLTHLVVGVDEEKKSQRSIKYMCALAASKWIVTYDWVEKCLKTKTVVDELPYEALDASGDPGPKLSRLATKKIFEGVSFYCMPPFSVLALDTLKQMLISAGGEVVEDIIGVKVKVGSTKPALLLAEPQHTQEDRFVFLAMEHSVVPVNYEWALNCLGCYSLCSFHDLLLCPPSLLPPATNNWPHILLAHDDDDEE